MRMILGLDAPDAGHARIGGRRYCDLRRPLREVGALLEAKAFQPGRSAAAHLTALVAANEIPRSRVEEVLGLRPDRGGATAGGHVLLGMAQRLGVATALLGDPGVLVLDEPTPSPWARTPTTPRGT